MPDDRSLPALMQRAMERARADDGSRFDPAASPLRGRIGFVVGAPRSGTTWLLALLARHPDVVTSSESDLLRGPTAALLDCYDRSLAAGETGPAFWVTRSELLTATRRFLDEIFGGAVRALEPDAAFVVEKTPDHPLYAAAQAACYPDARYVHILRHGGDVAASAQARWLGTHREWAEVWRDAVADMRTHLGPLRFLEIRYEDLAADPVGVLTQVLDHLGLDPAPAAAAVDAERRPINPNPTRAAWDTLSRGARWEIASGAGELMVESGYLTRQDLEAALGLNPLSRLARQAVLAARTVAPGASRNLAQSVRSRLFGRRFGSSMATLGQAAQAATDGDTHVLEQLLHPRVQLVRPTGPPIRGVRAVATSWARDAYGFRAHAVRSDGRSGVIELDHPGGDRTTHRVDLTGDRIRRIQT